MDELPRVGNQRAGRRVHGRSRGGGVRGRSIRGGYLGDVDGKGTWKKNGMCLVPDPTGVQAPLSNAGYLLYSCC